MTKTITVPLSKTKPVIQWHKPTPGFTNDGKDYITIKCSKPGYAYWSAGPCHFDEPVACLDYYRSWIPGTDPKKKYTFRHESGWDTVAISRPVKPTWENAMRFLASASEQVDMHHTFLEGAEVQGGVIILCLGS